MKKIYFVRHCSAHGQHRDSPLTNEGIKQARELASFFKDLNITFDLILSSPYLRAIESIKPFAELTNTTVQIDERLKERILSEEPAEDWMDALEQSFLDEHFSLPGGESARHLLHRCNGVLQPLYNDASIKHAIIVSHGNLLSHVFHQFDQRFGFNQWKELRNPDVYLLHLDGSNSKLECIWNSNQL
ncbi:histidine phosphatase family protein [Oceanobacillus polygoni]|uniref:2,3-bisphosphoglycerate-dependent phosphoglycerate mutase n=1 Tax=Oceanobacillus polygoni TaxID=1235259 RepID=A0A9X0YTC9_9BACI|nr:histidine phosphatase family protein [Oceanobacillus polygoni]MBP2078274.1 2,3-bisphosphoglycerate-dependent phosphoglycerate mutase [Oceanobacillus polygoni]